MKIQGMSYPEALERLGMDISRKTRTTLNPKPKWMPIYPVPADVGKTKPHNKLGKPDQVWTYLDASGDRLGHVCRFNLKNGGKAVLPLTYCEGPEGKRTWRWQSLSDPRPIYNLDRLAAHPEAPVLVVEGEKTADAAQGLLPDHVATTSPGGSKVAGKADWSPLKGRQVVIWPDADEPGRQYAADVARLAREVGATSVAVVELPKGLPKGWDLADDPPGDWQQDTIAKLVEAAREPAGGEIAWPEVVPFESHLAPSLPVEALPGWAQDFTRAAADHLQVAPCLVMANVLGAVATAIARKLTIEIKPGYREPLNLYTLAPAPPAERKTATQGLALEPLCKWEFEQTEAMKEEIQRAASQRKSQEAVISGLRGKLAKAKPEAREGMIREIADLEAKLVEVPTPPRLLADDITPEATAALMAQHGERLGIASCEGGLFDILAGRYSGGVANLDLVLKAHAGEQVRVDRKNGSPVVMADPALTMTLSPQPEVLTSLMNKPGFRGRGLLGRFAYVLPQSLLGQRIVDAPPLPERIVRTYRDALSLLLELPWAQDEYGEPASHVLRLDPSAYQAWAEFAGAVEPELADGGRFENVRDWAGKLPGLAARLAGNIHAMEHLEQAPGRKVQGPTMVRTLELTAALVGHALAAFGMMGADPDIEAAKHALAWIKREGREWFTLRDCHRGVRGRYPKAEQVKLALNILEDRGYIMPAPILNQSGPGRPSSPEYIVNPVALEVA